MEISQKNTRERGYHRIDGRKAAKAIQTVIVVFKEYGGGNEWGHSTKDFRFGEPKRMAYCEKANEVVRMYPSCP